METYDEIYEPPELVEVGEFAELTLGVPWGCPSDIPGWNTPWAC
ncbi:lasso RiPP family leader peptide-containing protein [Streptomyces ziwulingensis]|uniref:Lasso RiPP family leader peptide-containing protein n=1 Tax=Streptomyces ziwulingensis TaxID=1045501 RepID=A0ABP9BUA1_9ACTN